MSNKLILSNLNLRNKYFLYLLTHSRNFCSKDNDLKSANSTSEDSSSQVEKNERPEKTSVKGMNLRFKRAPISNETKEAAKEKLKSLLSDIEVTSENGKTSSSNLNLAKPVKRTSKKERLRQMEAERITPEKKMTMAVKAVADTFEKDSEKVESELSEKLAKLNLALGKLAKSAEKPEDPEIDPKMSENLMSSVDQVAATIAENPIPPRSELTKRLMKMSLDQKVSTDEQKSVRSVIEGMVIAQKQPEAQLQESRAERSKAYFQQRKQETLQRLRPRPDRMIAKIDLFGAEPLNIFSPDSEIKPDSTNVFWQKLQEKEVRLLSQFAPANAFEEMMLWTEQGKHWKLPVDNEIDMGAEEKVGFHEHVFLEKYLKGFPTKGPIRQFMELVCVGLSKNPYITVERKIENIEWFRNYFKEKEEILRETGAITSSIE